METATKQTSSRPLVLSAFRTEAVNLVGTAIAQRRAIIAQGKSWPLGVEHRQVMALYKVYKDSWTLRGIARFYLNHGKAVLDMIPWTNGPAVIRCKEIIEQSKYIVNHVA